jgi:HlyD family secretion protein
VIPNTAVRNEKGKSYIFKIEADKAKKIEVTIGQKFGDFVEVVSGLSSGDQIIDSLTDKIKDGSEVKTSN